MERVRSLNRSYLARNQRSAEEQIAGSMSSSASKKDKDDNDSFLNYLLQMRNSFGAGKSANVYQEGEIVKAEEQQGESETLGEEEVHSSAPLLPSTGPEIFAAIAILGLLMMLFGVRRQN